MTARRGLYCKIECLNSWRFSLLKEVFQIILKLFLNWEYWKLFHHSAFQLQPTIVSFRMLNKSDLVTMLQQCVEIFVSSSGKEFDKTVEKLKEFLTQFQEVEGECVPLYIPLQIKLKLFYNLNNEYHFPWWYPVIVSNHQIFQGFVVVFFLNMCTKLGNVYILYWHVVCAFCNMELWCKIRNWTDQQTLVTKSVIRIF